MSNKATPYAPYAKAFNEDPRIDFDYLSDIDREKEFERLDALIDVTRQNLEATTND